MAWGDPFEIVLLRDFAVGGEAGITGRYRRALPSRLFLVFAEYARSRRRFKSMRKGRECFKCKRHQRSRIPNESRNCLRHDAPLLRSRPALNQHFQIQILGCQALESVVADGAEMV